MPGPNRVAQLVVVVAALNQRAGSVGAAHRTVATAGAGEIGVDRSHRSNARSVSQLTGGAQSPTGGRGITDSTGEAVACADVAQRASGKRPRGQRDRGGLIGRRTIARGRSPAIGVPGGHGAAVGITGRDCADLAADSAHGNRSSSIHRGAVAQPSRPTRSPAEGFVIGYGAGVGIAGADLADLTSGDLAAPGQGRRGAIHRGAIAELTVGVGSPAEGHAVGYRTGVVRSHTDRGDRPVGQSASHRCRRRRSPAEGAAIGHGTGLTASRTQRSGGAGNAGHRRRRGADAGAPAVDISVGDRTAAVVPGADCRHELAREGGDHSGAGCRAGCATQCTDGAGSPAVGLATDDAAGVASPGGYGSEAELSSRRRGVGRAVRVAGVPAAVEVVRARARVRGGGRQRVGRRGPVTIGSWP